MAKKASVQALKSKSAVAPEIERRAHRALRQHLLDLLRGGNAHLNFEEALAGLPPNLRGERPAGLPYSPWRLLEHMRIAQQDILEFSRNPKHVSPEFPVGYWPETDAPPDDKAWQQSVRQFRDDLKAMQGLVEDPSIDLFAPIPHGEGQTLLREALLLADHNAYHLGQFVTVRRLLGAWES
jgi:DinB superfamily